MVYIQFSNTQLKTLKNLPNNLNDSLTYHNIGGLLVLNKVNEFKQIIMDFQSYNMDELFTTKKDKKVHLFKHIKNEDEKNNYVITFEIENMLKKAQDKEEYSCFSLPDIFSATATATSFADLIISASIAWFMFMLSLGFIPILDGC